MLADGAESDPRLARYYNRVSKRVRGTAGHNSAGVVISKSINNTNSAPGDAKPKTAKSESPTTHYALTVQAREIIEPPTSNAEARDSRSNKNVIEEETRASYRYTVGDMEVDTNAAVDHWMNYYGATPVGRSTMMIGIGRSHSYLEMARAEFREAGVPEDLVWLAFVESVWNPRAVSPAAAGGIWQFIPSTATDYGLTVEAGNDERSDPLKQTRVAAAYLRDLHTLFGDWALAMAAYNSGEPRVMGAIVKNGRADFWDLCDKQLLPKETRDYVPKILAAIKIASQAEDYGLAPVTRETASARG
ncbi:MAG TPA: lytic transglycosylase domain-containing protein [Blastocatellia bacterium]|nr:lytic transglycosylase domain-containing protein [Blastocatellia bacterium]